MRQPGLVSSLMQDCLQSIPSKTSTTKQLGYSACLCGFNRVKLTKYGFEHLALTSRVQRCRSLDLHYIYSYMCTNWQNRSLDIHLDKPVSLFLTHQEIYIYSEDPTKSDDPTYIIIPSLIHEGWSNTGHKIIPQQATAIDIYHHLVLNPGCCSQRGAR